MEVRKLEGLSALQEVSLAGNPVARQHEYRLTLIQRLSALRTLDAIPIGDEERVRAEMYLLEQTALQQAALAAAGAATGPLGSLELLAPAPPDLLPSAAAGSGMLLGRNLSVPLQAAGFVASSSGPIRITNVSLFNVTQTANLIGARAQHTADRALLYCVSTEHRVSQNGTALQCIGNNEDY